MRCGPISPPQLRPGKDASQAYPLFKQACDGRAMYSCYLLGACYRKGQGTSKSAATAFKLYEQACDGNFGPACRAMAQMYRDGEGFPKTARAPTRLSNWPAHAPIPSAAISFDVRIK